MIFQGHAACKHLSQNPDPSLPGHGFISLSKNCKWPVSCSSPILCHRAQGRERDSGSRHTSVNREIYFQVIICMGHWRTVLGFFPTICTFCVKTCGYLISSLEGQSLKNFELQEPRTRGGDVWCERSGPTDGTWDSDPAWHSRGVSLAGSHTLSASLSLSVCWLQSGQLGKGTEIARRPRLG